MKTTSLQKLAALMAAGLTLTGSTLLAQSSATANPAPPAAVSTAAPWLPPGAAQVLQLVQAKVGDDTIVAYVKNSGTGYYFNADQIIYLRQQGLSDAVLTAMLNQPKSAPAPAADAPAAVATAPAPAPVASTASTDAGTTITTASGSTATVAPSVTYVQTAPATVYYSQPYYYPGYAWYPPVSLSFGWGWGGGWHGGGWHH